MQSARLQELSNSCFKCMAFTYEERVRWLPVEAICAQCCLCTDATAESKASGQFRTYVHLKSSMQMENPRP